MTNRETIDILRAKGVNKLYHVNTVLTSGTYLEEGGLLSRHAV